MTPNRDREITSVMNTIHRETIMNNNQGGPRILTDQQNREIWSPWLSRTKNDCDTMKELGRTKGYWDKWTNNWYGYNLGRCMVKKLTHDEQRIFMVIKLCVRIPDKYVSLLSNLLDYNIHSSKLKCIHHISESLQFTKYVPVFLPVITLVLIWIE